VRKPDFLIVGAMKAGTTTLANLLNQSPHIFLPGKELHYFDRDFDKPFKSYLNNFPSDQHQVVGEKTPTYSYDPEVPKRIHEVLPDVKLIWILRNPVDRAYSNYWHAYKKGVELETFKKAIKNDNERYKKYLEQIERYLKYFPLNQMHFLLFENLKSDEQKEINALTDFLGVPSFTIEELPKSNKTYLPKSIYVESIAQKIFGRSVFFKIIHHLNKKSAPGYPKLSKDLREQLNEYFSPHNQRLANLVSLNLKAWD
jgi:hypothetical protein